MDGIEELNKKGKEVLGFFGTVTSLLSMAWDTLWTVGIMGIIGWFAYQTEAGKQFMDQAFEWLASTEFGKGLINMIGGFMEALGFEHPLKGASVDAITRRLTDESSTQAEKDHASAVATILEPHWGRKDGLVDKGLISKDAIAKPEGIKKLLHIISDDDAVKLVRLLKNAPASTNPEKAKEQAKFKTTLESSLKTLQADAGFIAALTNTHPKLTAQLVRDAFSGTTAPQTPVPPVQTQQPAPSATTPPAQGTTPSTSPSAITPQTSAAPSAQPHAAATIAATPSHAEFLESLGISHNNPATSTMAQLLSSDKNALAFAKLYTATAAAPKSQETALRETITSLANTGKLDLSKQAEIVGLFGNETHRKAVTDFLTTLDVSVVTDAKTKATLEVVKKHAGAVTEILGDATSVEWLNAKMNAPEDLANKGIKNGAAMLGSLVSPERVLQMKQIAVRAMGAPEPIVKHIEAVEALHAATTDKPAVPVKTGALPEADSGIAEAVKSASFGKDSDAKVMTVVNVESVDPKTAHMVAALLEQHNKAQAIA